MRVYFDFYEIALGKGKSIGIYNYALAVLKTLAINKKDLNIIVACSGANEAELRKLPNLKLKVISDQYPTFRQRILWRAYNAIKEAKIENADIYYSPKGFSPGLFKRKSKPFIVLTVHDMIPFYYMENYPNYFTAFENHFITKSLIHSVKIANKVITISDFSKQMILKYCSKNTDVNVVYNGVSVRESAIRNNDSDPYIFAITSNLPHKNKEKLIRGYIQYRKRVENPIPLIVCGINNDQLNLLEEEKGFVECIQFADSTQFSDLFSNATLFLFLPKIEGFGFPPLEALLYGVPTVVSDISVLREVLGQAAYFVDPLDENKIADGIINVLSDSTIQDRIKLSGKDIIHKYTWENCGKQIYEVFRKTME